MTVAAAPWWATPVIAGVFLVVGGILGALLNHALSTRAERLKRVTDESLELNREGRLVAASTSTAIEHYVQAVESGEGATLALGQLREAIAATRMSCSSRLAHTADSLAELAAVVERERGRPDGDVSKALADFIASRAEFEYTVRVVMRLDSKD